VTRAARALAAAAMLICAACDDANVVTPPPPPPPACPTLEDYFHTIAIARTTGATINATASGNFAFLANGADGIVISDFSSSADAVVVAGVPSLVDTRAVDIEGSLLFVANGDDGLAIVDVANPGAPQVLGVATMPGCAVDVDASGALAYVANDAIGLVIVDASDPGAPVIRGIENMPGKAVGVAAPDADPLAVVADETLGVRMVNVADPDAPFLIRSVAVPGVAQAVAYEDGVVAVAAQLAGLVMIAPAPGGAVVGQLGTPGGEALGVAMKDRTAFVAGASGGVIVADVSEPASPKLINSLGAAPYVRDVAVAAGRLVTADEQAGARVVEIGRPMEPPLDTPAGIDDARALAPLGDLLVVADASHGLWIVDPVTRQVVGDLSIAGTPVDVCMEDSLAYVNTADIGVVAADLHDPAVPVDLGVVPGSNGADAVAVDAPFIYMVQGGGVLVVESRLDGSGFPRYYDASGSFVQSITVDDANLYLPGLLDNVLIVDRASMRLAGAMPVGGSAQRVVIRYEGGPLFPLPRVVVALSGSPNYQAAIETWDFTTLFAPRLISRIACDGDAVDVAMEGAWMVVAEGDDGCEVFGQTALREPRPIGHLMGPAPRAIVVAGMIAVAGGTRGLQLVDPTDCLE
jgi:hypothetical protein